MYEVKLVNIETQKVFYKTYYSPYLLRKFENKVKRSKKIQIISIFKMY